MTLKIADLCLLWLYFWSFLVESDTVSHFSEPLFKQFYEFAVKYRKPYVFNVSDNDTPELITRYMIFKENVAHAWFLNKRYNDTKSPVYGINKFADLSHEEFKEKYLSGLRSKHADSYKRNNFLPATHEQDLKKCGLPPAVDWRQKSAVSDIKDQKQCGACWSFSVVETVESMSAIQLNRTVPKLSVQQLIDCDKKNDGCKGGDICEACSWISKNGVVMESKYPLTDHTDSCKKVQKVPHTFTKNCNCQRFTGHETGILKLLADHGPVAVAVDATTWHNYVGGIIQFHCSTHINHAVQIVGYNLSGDVPYYIVRNSWGKDFGDNGFLYLKYGENICGLTDEVVDLNVVNANGEGNGHF